MNGIFITYTIYSTNIFYYLLLRVLQPLLGQSKRFLNTAYIPINTLKIYTIKSLSYIFTFFIISPYLLRASRIYNGPLLAVTVNIPFVEQIKPNDIPK